MWKLAFLIIVILVLLSIECKPTSAFGGIGANAADIGMNRQSVREEIAGKTYVPWFPDEPGARTVRLPDELINEIQADSVGTTKRDQSKINTTDYGQVRETLRQMDIDYGHPHDHSSWKPEFSEDKLELIARIDNQ
jgi:hypothetical protein